MKIFILAADEVMRFLSTRRGLVSLAGFALVWLAILFYWVLPASRFVSAASNSGLVELVLQEFKWLVMDQWPAVELGVYWLACLYLLPFLAIITAADQTASDRARGTLRYLALRCDRLDIFFGRYIGQMLVLFFVVLITLGSVLTVIALNSVMDFPAVIASSAVIVVNLMLILAPYVALMALVSALARSARQATLFAVILWIVALMLTGYLKNILPNMRLLDWVLPGSHVSELATLFDWQTLAFAPIPLVQTLVLLGAGAVVMWRRDI